MPHNDLLPMAVPAIIGGLCGLIGALFGSILGPFVTFRLNDKTRKLDLYKSVFPLKVEAAQNVIKLAYAVYHEVYSSNPEGLPEEEVQKRREKKKPYESDWAAYRALSKQELDELSLYSPEQKIAWENLQERVAQLRLAASEAEWILGIEVRNSVADFLTASEDKLLPGSRSGDIEKAASLWFYKFRNMENVLRQKIHLSELEGAVKVEPKERDPLSYQREG